MWKCYISAMIKILSILKKELGINSYIKGYNLPFPMALVNLCEKTLYSLMRADLQICGLLSSGVM